MLGPFSAALLFSLYITGTTCHVSSSSNIERRTISQDQMDQFIRFTKLSFAAYNSECTSPLGSTLIKTLNNLETNTQGFISRDDTVKQIIASFRGTQFYELQDDLTDLNIQLVPLTSHGVNDINNAHVHSGFLTAYNSVASDVLEAVSSELETHPDYTLIATGHSLGGSLASLAGVSLASNFRGAPLQVFTFGQPRTGDAAYADFVEELIGTANLFRAVHTSDGVPTMLLQELSYRHYGTEYWNFENPSHLIENVRTCHGQEDPACSDSIPSTGINIPHFTYFGLNFLNITYNQNAASALCY